MTIRVRFWCENGMQGGDREDFEEFPDDTPEEEIEEAARDWFFNLNSYGWHRVEKKTEARPAAPETERAGRA